MQKIKICAISDTHGFLPKIPECDFLCVAGDILPLNIQRDFNKSIGWLNGPFAEWCLDIFNRGTVIVGVAGNHDIAFQQIPNLIPRDIFWKYLEDGGVSYQGLNFWGTPWQLPFGYGWAYNAEEDMLDLKYSRIPDNTDVIISHGPPFKHGDAVKQFGYDFYGNALEDNIHVGSHTLLNVIYKVKPKLVVVGHIHGGRGIYKVDDIDTIVVNASIMDEEYKPVNEPIIVEI